MEKELGPKNALYGLWDTSRLGLIVFTNVASSKSKYSLLIMNVAHRCY